ncbi:MAG: hypothetical protein H6541_12650 [Lentimicrobiaceae bacterium]|nr:hypothetical protein [Lentimicrobiaceae bacterium]MCB9024064.1 hypothetical protein [Lentimicrobiaceae bacterium]MCO5266710.1 hypothetical protein [Lentimicrobium sp.]HPG34330.1 hypothetical protein [Lentimicrobium sp.]
MKVLIRNIAVLLVLVAFLLPSTGVLVFLHHCKSKGTIQASLDGSNTCCKTRSSLFKATEPDVCALAHENHCTHHSFLAQETCCDDTHFYVKINMEYLSEMSQSFQANVFAIELPGVPEIHPVYLADLPPGIIPDWPVPPDIGTYLKVSSLRL